MRRDPVGRFRIVLAFLKPHPYQLTRRRLMVVQRTAKAEMMLAEALNGRHSPVEVTFFDWAVDSVYAVRRRTPFEVVHVVNIRPR